MLQTETNTSLYTKNPILPSMPFEAFEHYMLADDRPSHSMTCHVRFWFRGRLNPTDLKNALTKTLPQHPMFQMTVAGSIASPTRNIHWKPMRTPVMPYIDWAPAGTPIEAPPQGMAIDLTNEIGFRLIIRDQDTPSPTQTLLIFQFHHAVCDGIGVFEFMEDLLTEYGKLRGEVSTPTAMRDLSLLPGRGTFGLSAEDLRKRKHLDMARSLKYFKNRATPLALPTRAKSELTATADILAYERVIIPGPELELIRAKARSGNASVNDLMIYHLFKALRTWNKSQGTSRQNIRIAIPTNLRRPSDHKMPAANIVSMIFLDRSQDEIDQPELLRSIVNETHSIKDGNLGLALPRVFKRLGRHPGLVKLFMRLPLCSATAVLTNLGRPYSSSPFANQDQKLQIGELILESVDTIPPIRPKTRVSISVNYYGGSLSATLRYDTTVMTKADARDILERFITQLKEGA